MKPTSLLLSAFLLFSAACASAPVDLNEPRRVVGTENNVRLDAEVFGEKMNSGSTIGIKYDITNQRNEPIAVADIIPDTVYDPETQTVTIDLGSEVPGNELLPRLITILPGEKKSFSSSARIRVVVPPISTNPYQVVPNALRLKLNFLGGNLESFRPLAEMTQKALHDPKLADTLFPQWVERNEVVYTNALPMRWEGAAASSRNNITGRRF